MTKHFQKLENTLIRDKIYRNVSILSNQVNTDCGIPIFSYVDGCREWGEAKYSKGEGLGRTFQKFKER